MTSRRVALSAGGSVSTRQSQERRDDAANPEGTVHREVTSSASVQYEVGGFSRVRDRLSLAAEMKPEARPKTDAELAAEQGLADWNKRRADDEAERQRRVASGKIIYRN
jgi:hypothetical protein